ncbi:SDR family oxidoreductase [Caulobacter sp. NIBR1757]|uniref:SDR family NAD(P)-dependent oxidoreductase n=1 Tax=Caulobacter sp. NIBR1757 TaxID=3016000 RepID=UPI0022F037AB|nr:SDR family oxidoreductase [Caulobacter sp. NIBR1757]WGM37683.1 Dihydroanticapsin 7-dehydrogenase [Caulobacter sp. NIBR1757]
MDLDFTGKRVLVVGGTSGIGNGIAHGFRTRGAQVAVWGTRPQDDYRKEDGSDLEGLTFHQVDASDSAAVEAAPSPFDGLDVLVLAQGTVLYRKGEFEMDGFRKVVGVNLDSLMACSMRFLDDLKSSGGNIVTISSTAAFHATRGNPAYNASKAGAVALTRTLGQAWATDGVRVNGVAPGLVATKLTKVTTDNPDRLAASLRGIPLNRLGTPEDMAGAVLFLASPLASYITGQTLIVDGGLTL